MFEFIAIILVVSLGVRWTTMWYDINWKCSFGLHDLKKTTARYTKDLITDYYKCRICGHKESRYRYPTQFKKL